MSTLTSLASSPTHQPLPVSLSSIDADIDLELPFVHEIAQRSLTIQAKRAVTIQNALVASQCTSLSSKLPFYRFDFLFSASLYDPRGSKTPQTDKKIRKRYFDVSDATRKHL